MTRILQNSLPSCFILAGLGLSIVGYSGLGSGIRHSQNPFCIQGSAYGKLMARLSESTIDRVWHLGVEELAPHGMGDHDHSQCNHDHGHGESSHGAHEHTDMATTDHDESWIDLGKEWLQQRSNAGYVRTNPHSLSQAHLASVYSDIERMLLRSFKMDPTNYGAYDSYHLFLTTYDFGGSPQKYEQAKTIANIVIQTAMQEKEDPEPWLTAAAAATNLYQMASAIYAESHTSQPVEMLKEHRDRIGYCLQRFQQIQAESEAKGIWKNLSRDRQMEIAERSNFLSRTFGQFDAMIARAEAKKAPVESEVAEREKADEKE